MSNSNIISIKKMGFPWETQDPFLFCAHHADAYPKGNNEMGPDASLAGRMIGEDFTKKDGWRMYHGRKIPGFPYHPHRGFETITIAKEGTVDHADSLGAAGRFSNGDVQWMTAGKGVLHSEMFPMLNEDKENPLEIFQIWLNLPAANKMVDPYFSVLWSENIPVVETKDQNGKQTVVNVVAGKYLDHIPPHPAPNSWAKNPDNEVRVWTIRMESGAKWTLPKAHGHVSRTLFFYDGDTAEIDGNLTSSYHSAELKSEKDIEIKAGKKTAYFLFLQGKPINEPVAKYGPFVMNTEGEIQQAFMDYQRTQFGGWPWGRPDPVHPREKPRFAKYVDGTEEERN